MSHVVGSATPSQIQIFSAWFFVFCTSNHNKMDLQHLGKKSSDSSKWMNFKIFQGLKWSPLVTPRRSQLHLPEFSTTPDGPPLLPWFLRDPWCSQGATRPHSAPSRAVGIQCLLFFPIWAHIHFYCLKLWHVFYCLKFYGHFFHSTQIKKSYLAIATTPPIFNRGNFYALAKRDAALLFRWHATWHVTPRRWGEPRIRAGKKPVNRWMGSLGFIGFTWFMACCIPINGSFTWEFTRFTWIYTYIYIHIRIYI